MRLRVSTGSHVIRIIADVSASPDPSFFGLTAVQAIINGLMAIVLAVCLGSFFYGASQMVTGRGFGNSGMGSDGKVRMLLSGLGAAALAAGAGWINFAFHWGQTIH